MASRSFIDYLLNPGPDAEELQEAIRAAAGVADDIAAAFVLIDAAVATTAAVVVTVNAQVTYVEGIIAAFDADAGAAIAAIAADRASALAAIDGASDTAQSSLTAIAAAAVTDISEARDEAVAASDAAVSTVNAAVTTGLADITATGNDIETNLLIVKAQTEELRNETEEYRDEALAAVGSIVLPAISAGDAGKLLTVNPAETGYDLKDPPTGRVISRAWAIDNYHPTEAPDAFAVDGYATAGDGGAALYRHVVAEPAHEAKLNIMLADAVTREWYEIAESVIDPVMLGADPTGVADARTAILATSAAALALKCGMRWTKTHKIASAATILRRVWFEQGGLAILPTGVRVGFAGGIVAGDYKIFDYADRSSRAYVRNAVTRGYWWGVDMGLNHPADGRTDNNVPLQYACDSVAGYGFGNDQSYTYSWEGGVIELPAGYCRMEAGVIMHSYTTIRGTSRSTIIEPNEETWTGSDDYLFKMYRELTGAATITIANPAVITSAAHGLSEGNMVIFSSTGALPTGIVAGTFYYVRAGVTTNTFTISATDGGAAVVTTGSQSGVHTWHKGVSQFNVRLENLRIAGRGFSGVTHQVLAYSAQEQCGLYNVHLDSIYRFGLTFKYGYGGAAVMEMSQCEAWLDVACSVVARCINVDATGYTQGWISFILDHITVAGAIAPTIGVDEWCGIYGIGRVLFEVRGIHSEYLIYGAILDGSASMIGGSVKGGPSVRYTIATTNYNKAAGRVDVQARQGNSQELFHDFDGGYLLYKFDTPDGRVLFPPDPNKAIGSISVVSGGGTPTASYSRGNINPTIGKPGTGRYTFELLNDLGNVAHYRVRVDFEYQSAANPLVQTISRNGPGVFEVRFKDAAGAALNVEEFQVHVLHIP